MCSNHFGEVLIKFKLFGGLGLGFRLGIQVERVFKELGFVSINVSLKVLMRGRRKTVWVLIRVFLRGLREEFSGFM